MSEYSFQCWNNSCGDTIDRDWDEVEEDTSGRMAYCSDDCFKEDCQRESKSFNDTRNINPPYTVGDEDSESLLLSMLKQRNPYIAHSIEEEEADTFAGNWHYIWIPDLEDLKTFAEETAEEGQDITEVMANIDYSEWEEFMMFTHPVKGIALIQAWNNLASLSMSIYISKGQIQMDTATSDPTFQQK
jgi:hypothetical protein